MSMQVKFKDEYNSTTSYYGTVDKKYNFVAEVVYFSNQGNYVINSIKWIEKPMKKKDVMLARKKIVGIAKEMTSSGEMRVEDILSGVDDEMIE